MAYDLRILPADGDHRLLVDLVIDQAVEAYRDWQAALGNDQVGSLQTGWAHATYRGTIACLKAVLHAEASDAEWIVKCIAEED